MTQKHEPSDELPKDVTPGGSEIIRHEPSMDDSGEVVYLTQEQMDRIEAHVEKHFGPVENVLHEIVSVGVHLDLLPVPFEAEGEKLLFVCTMGMSAAPMNVPAVDIADLDPEKDMPPPSPRAELFMVLPGDWPDPGTDEDHHWPFGLLKDLGRLPSMYDTYLGVFHTVPNGDPAEPFSEECGFVGAILMPGQVINEDGFAHLEDEEGHIDFLLVVPLYAEEMDYKLKKGPDALMDKFDEAGIPPQDLAKPGRPNVCAKKRWGLW